MTIDDRIEVFLGFLGNDSAWLQEELRNKGKVTFDPADRTPHHIVLSSSDKSLVYQYVQCVMPMRNVLSSARAGMEGEQIASITVYSLSRPGTRDVFKRNCVQMTKEDLNMQTGPDTNSVIDELLSIKGVHVMQEKTLRFSGELLFSNLDLYGSNDDFIKRVRNEIKYGAQVFLYGYVQEKGRPDPPHRLNWWRWVAYKPDQA
jgi:hypothetical protein